MKRSELNRYGEMYIENLKETNPKKYNRMKKAFSLLLFVVTFFFVSCDFSGESNYTPGIFFLQSPIKNSKDTIRVGIAGEQDLLLLDTIQVGDTVRFVMRMEAYANRLTALAGVCFRLMLQK